MNLNMPEEELQLLGDLATFLKQRVKEAQESQKQWEKNNADSASTFSFGMQLAFEETLRFIYYYPSKQEDDSTE